MKLGRLFTFFLSHIFFVYYLYHYSLYHSKKYFFKTIISLVREKYSTVSFWYYYYFVLINIFLSTLLICTYIFLFTLCSFISFILYIFIPPFSKVWITTSGSLFSQVSHIISREICSSWVLKAWECLCPTSPQDSVHSAHQAVTEAVPGPILHSLFSWTTAGTICDNSASLRSRGQDGIKHIRDLSG